MWFVCSRRRSGSSLPCRSRRSDTADWDIVRGRCDTIVWSNRSPVLERNRPRRCPRCWRSDPWSSRWSRDAGYPSTSLWGWKEAHQKRDPIRPRTCCHLTRDSWIPLQQRCWLFQLVWDWLFDWLTTWSPEIGVYAVNGDSRISAGSSEGDLMPHTIVQSFSRSALFQRSRSQIEMYVNLTHVDFYGEIIHLWEKKGKKLDDRSEWRTRICFTLGGRIPPLKRIMPLPSFVRNLKEMFPDFFAIQAGRIFKNKKGYLNYSFFAVFVTDYQVRLARGKSDGIQSLAVRTVELQSTDDRDQMTARLGQFQHVQPQRIGHELHLERNVSVTAQLEDQLKMLKDNDRLPFSCSPQSYCALVLRARLVCWCCRRRKRDRSTASWIYRRCDCGRRTLHPPRRTTEYKW